MDDLAGTVHRAYGLMPNMTWVIDRGGVAYKANWTSAANVEAFQVTARRRYQRRAAFAIRFRGDPNSGSASHSLITGYMVIAFTSDNWGQQGCRAVPTATPGSAGTRRCGHHQAHGGAGALIEEARRGTR